MAFLAGIFYEILWWVFIQGPLQIINAFGEIVNYLGGSLVLKLLFGINPDFSFSGIPTAFYAMIGVGISIGVLLFAVSMCVQLAVGKDEELVMKAINAFKFTVVGFSLIFFIPFLILFFGSFLNALGYVIPQLFDSQTNNLAVFLYQLGAPSFNPHPYVPSDFGPPSFGTLMHYNFIMTLLGTWFVLINIVLIGVQLIVKAIEIFILFIFSPVVAFSSVTDNGGRIIVLKNMIFTRYAGTIIQIIGFSIGMYAMNAVNGIINNLVQDDQTLGGYLLKTLLGFFVVSGGSTVILGINQLAAGFIGQDAGLRETLSNVKGTMAGAAAVAGFATRGVLGKTKNIVGGFTGASEKGIGGMISGMRGKSDTKGMLGKIGSMLGQDRQEKYEIKQETRGMNKDRKATFLQNQLYEMKKKNLENNAILDPRTGATIAEHAFDTKKFNALDEAMNKNQGKIKKRNIKMERRAERKANKDKK